MTIYVIQKFNAKRGHWEDDAETYAIHEARVLLREARAETDDARMIQRRV